MRQFGPTYGDTRAQGAAGTIRPLFLVFRQLVDGIDASAQLQLEVPAKSFHSIADATS